MWSPEGFVLTRYGLKFADERKQYFKRLLLERGIFHPENIRVSRTSRWDEHRISPP